MVIHELMLVILAIFNIGLIGLPTDGHVFYSLNGEKMRINDAATINVTGSLYFGQNDSYSDLQ
jgi:hypothetical protein